MMEVTVDNIMSWTSAQPLHVRLPYRLTDDLLLEANKAIAEHTPFTGDVQNPEDIDAYALQVDTITANSSINAYLFPHVTGYLSAMGIDLEVVTGDGSKIGKFVSVDAPADMAVSILEQFLSKGGAGIKPDLRDYFKRVLPGYKRLYQHVD